MAQRYAASQPRKATRRRTLPRVSEGDGEAGGPENLAANRAGEAVFTAEGPERAGGGIPRRAAVRGAGAARSSAPSSASIPRVDYAYVRRDLRRIALTGAAMFILLIVLNLVLQAVLR